MEEPIQSPSIPSVALTESVPIEKGASDVVPSSQESNENISASSSLSSNPIIEEAEQLIQNFEVKPKKLKKPKAQPESAFKFIGEDGAVDITYEQVDMSPITVDKEEMRRRKFLSTERWFSISRPQYKAGCGVASLTAIWNSLYTVLGYGSLPPLSQDQVLNILGFKQPFASISFGPFTGNITLMRWFKKLCDHFKVRGKGSFFWKVSGTNRTIGVTAEDALNGLKAGLRDPNCAFIYHCYNHYCVPIGYEDTPYAAADAYNSGVSPSDCESWILIGDSSRTNPGIACVKWDHIKTDLECQNPFYFNIRHAYKGVERRNTSKVGGNLHCIMMFRSDVSDEDWNLPLGEEEEAEEESNSGSVSKAAEAASSSADSQILDSEQIA